MKKLCLLLCLFIVLLSCRNGTSEENIVSEMENNLETEMENKDASPETVTKPILALTSNALQLVDSNTGSTREVPFGMAEGQMVEMLTNVLGESPNSIQVNEECGAGPLKMTAWNNGLTVIFQDANQNGEWLFGGWFITETLDSSQKITTMAGIGIGSTRGAMEEAYVIEVYESTLGQEFSTSSGLYGIFDGDSKNAKIIHMWSGLSCNFR